MVVEVGVEVRARARTRPRARIEDKVEIKVRAAIQKGTSVKAKEKACKIRAGGLLLSIGALKELLASLLSKKSINGKFR